MNGDLDVAPDKKVFLVYDTQIFGQCHPGIELILRHERRPRSSYGEAIG